MTISVKVLNNDSRSSAVISVETQDTEGNPVPGVPAKELPGWTSAEFTVHSGQQLQVKEVRM